VVDQAQKEADTAVFTNDYVTEVIAQTETNNHNLSILLIFELEL